MTLPEFENWREFYRLYPFDDYHRFHRPAALISASHPELKDPAASIAKRLEWLRPDPVVGDFSDADMRTLAALGLKPPRG